MKKTYLLLILLFFTKYVFTQVTFTDVAVSMGVNDPGAGQGAVLLDVNNDGFLDIFLNNNANQNKLWINNGGTAYTDESVSYGLNFTGPGRGVSAADFNNDGLIDIIVGQFNATIILYKNINGSFTNFTTNAGVSFTGWGGSINWFDFNNDGKIDAAFANDGVPYHYNYLFRNDNLSSFTNVAYSVGLTDSLSTLTLATADYDNDGDLDLFCGSQTQNPSGTGTTMLYKNNGNGTFTDVTFASGIFSAFYTWGSEWGDYDNDGDMDIYLANYTGNNQLYKNNGDGTFNEVSNSMGLNDAGQSYSCGWFDYDNDADLDLYVAKSSSAIDRLYRNDGTTFVDVAPSVGTNDNRHSACISLGDFNNDGFVDIYLVNNGSENRLYKSNAGNSNKWIILKLSGVASNRSAIGARVSVRTGSLRQIREVEGGSGGKGQNSLPVEFGLGFANIIDSLSVRWPSGTVQNFTNVNPNMIYSLAEGGILLGVNQTGTNIPESFALMQNFPNPFNPETKIHFLIPLLRGVDAEGGRGVLTKLIVYDILGNEVSVLVNEQLMPGSYEVTFNAGKLASGVYFYRLAIGDYKETRKMVLVR